MSLTRNDRDLVGLSVLAMLFTGPRHTYEMHRMMVDTRKDFVTGLPRSMYHAVERLQKADLLAPVETVRDGTKPERTVYAITERGVDRVQSQVERLLQVPDADANLFTAALSFVVCLPLSRAAAALKARRDTLAAREVELAAELDEAARHVPRILLIEGEHELVSTRCQLTWVRQLLDEIDRGELAWPTDVGELVMEPEGSSG
jgi:DNA-binding PadR family transcriptional regulator